MNGSIARKSYDHYNKNEGINVGKIIHLLIKIHQDFYLFPIAGAMFVVNGGVYALSAPVWGYLCDKRLPPIIVTLLGSVCIAVAFLFIGPVPFIPVPTSLGLCIGMLFIHGLGFAAQLVAAFSSAHSEALIAGKAFKIFTR